MLRIVNAHLPLSDEDFDTGDPVLAAKRQNELFSIYCDETEGVVRKIRLQDQYIELGSAQSSEDGERVQEVDARGGICIPSLCHAHIHLDKCYLFDPPEPASLSSSVDGDIQGSDEPVGPFPIQTGTFSEALRLTSELQSSPLYARTLYSRGTRLLRESLLFGVTSLRAHVEVDEQIGFLALDAAERLKMDWKGKIEIQIAAFAQKPMFEASGDSTEVHKLMKEAARRSQVSVIGSAPYVEHRRDLQERNIREIIQLTDAHGCGIDFHLDYDLRPLQGGEPQPLLYHLLSELTVTEASENSRSSKRQRHITIGHATRLSQLSDEEWIKFLQERVKPAGVTLHFVGLPHSDAYMMGKTEADMLHVGKGYGCGMRPRGTLDIPRLSLLMKMGQSSSDLSGKADVCLAVNNVGNPFTPQVNPDPLALCQMGVSIYQSSTAVACRALLESVTTVASLMISIPTPEQRNHGLRINAQSPADLLVIPGRDFSRVESIVLNPPAERLVIKRGKLIASRRVEWSIL